MHRSGWVRHLWLSAFLSTGILALPARAQSHAPAEAPSLTLRGGDAVRLLVRDEPELTGEYPVLEDGSVLLPLIGLVPVGGVAFAQVVERVVAAYRRELVDREVVLQALVRVRVGGEVRQPGLYLVDATFELGDVVAQAGGMMPTASAGKVLLVRAGSSERFDLRPGGAARRVSLQAADEVFVPRRNWINDNAPVLIGAATSVLAAALTALLVR